MAEFEPAYAPLKLYEGGYDNDPDDGGGETYAGISRRFFLAWSGWKLIDQLRKTHKTKAAISEAAAADFYIQDLVRAFYKTEWFDRLGLGDLPQILANEIFEQAVNLGNAGNGKKVQIICNAYNRARNGDALFGDLVVDGAIGPKTLSALKAILADKATAENIVHALNCMQGAHYLELAAKKPSQRKFTVGWMKRTHCHD